MIPKVASCTHAVRNGVHNAHILDGRIAHVLLLEIFTDSGIGTMIKGAGAEPPGEVTNRHAASFDERSEANGTPRVAVSVPSPIEPAQAQEGTT
jgi:hypothetical protein